jgi:hypothetical protein
LATKSGNLPCRYHLTSLKATAGHSTPYYIQHLWTAHASGAELETQVEIGRRVDLFTEHQAEALIRDAQEVGRMINGLVRSLERSERERGRKRGVRMG